MTASFREELGDRRHRQPQRERLIGKAFELVASVEALRFLMLGVEQDRHDADIAGSAKHPVEGIQEEVFPQSVPLKLPIYRKAGEPRRWNGEAREPLRCVRGQIVTIDGAGRDGVIAQHLPWPAASRCDEGLRNTRFMVLAREARQVLVESRLPAGKVASIV